MKQFNIALIHCHDTGRYISPYGFAVDTPHMLRAAQEGMLFRQMYCAAPACSPSRAAMLTGQCAHSAGMLGLVNRGFDIACPERHLAKMLSEHGFHTILAGVQHILRDRNKSPYDEILNTAGMDTPKIVRQGLQSLDSLSKEAPFFLDIGFGDTHRPFDTEHLVYDPNYVRPPLPLPDTPAVRRDFAGFMEAARRYDDAVGMVLGGLRDRHLLDDTLVIITTDHGIAFPGMKCNLTTHGTGVLFILRKPNMVPMGTVCDQLVSQVDLYPTLCDLAGIEPPAWLQGRSMAPLLQDSNTPIHEEIFVEQTYHCNYEPERGIRTGRYLYIERSVEYPKTHAANCDPGLSKTEALEKGWMDRTVDDVQLYDTYFDPHEACNLAYDARYKQIADGLHSRLLAWETRTGDPLLQKGEGRVMGYTANTQDGRIYVNAYEDVEPQDIWQYEEQKNGYA